MEISLSKRMQAVANLMKPAKVACDVGCDHGYVSIYLVKSGVCDKMIAMDVRQGPLSQARLHVEEAGLGDYIETRLSDGLHGLRPGECDAMICAGMGGKLMVRILEEGQKKIEGMDQMILQPQSDIAFVRNYLYKQGLTIEEEDMVLEDGKFYPMMRVVRKKPDLMQSQPLQQKYGPVLLDRGHPVLLAYLRKQKTTYERIKEQLLENGGNCIRLQEIEKELIETQETIARVMERGYNG